MVARWWLSLGLGLVLLEVSLGSVLVPPLCFFFSFRGDVPRNGHFRLVTAGVTFLLPDGRDVGSRQGHRPKNRVNFRNPLLQLHRTCSSPSFSTSLYLWQSGVFFFFDGVHGDDLLRHVTKGVFGYPASCSFGPHKPRHAAVQPSIPGVFLIRSSLPRSRGENAALMNHGPLGQHWPLHLASSSIHQLQQVSCADHLRIDGISLETGTL